MKNLALGLTAFTAFGIVDYWTLVFVKIFPVTEFVPGYKNWFMSFPLADGWSPVTSLLAFIFLLRGDDKAALFGLLAASGLLFILTTDGMIEIAIKIYSLSVGSFFIVFFGNHRYAFISR